MAALLAFPPSSVKSPPCKTCLVFWCMTASRPAIIKTCPSALCSTRSSPVSPVWAVLSCGCVVKQPGEEEDGVSFSWSSECQLIILMPKSSKRYLETWCLVHTCHQLSRWCPATVVSQMASCSTLTLSWSWGEKRCRTPLGLCWWRAARPIRRRAMSHHVTASPIAIYFTIGQMKRLILTICFLMCFSHSHSFCLLRFLTILFFFFSPSFLLSTPSNCHWLNLKNHLLCWVTFQDTINEENHVDR